MNFTWQSRSGIEKQSLKLKIWKYMEQIRSAVRMEWIFGKKHVQSCHFRTFNIGIFFIELRLNSLQLTWWDRLQSMRGPCLHSFSSTGCAWNPVYWNVHLIGIKDCNKNKSYFFLEREGLLSIVERLLQWQIGRAHCDLGDSGRTGGIVKIANGSYQHLNHEREKSWRLILRRLDMTSPWPRDPEISKRPRDLRRKARQSSSQTLSRKRKSWSF